MTDPISHTTIRAIARTEDIAAWRRSPSRVRPPLSTRLATLREQLCGMIDAGEVIGRVDELRGLELELLEMSGEAFALENADALRKVWLPRWVRWGRL